MNLLQFIITLILAVALAGLSIWNAVAAQGNASLAQEQVRLQGVLTNARTQQGVLEQVLQRTAVIGQKDQEILDLLAKYGLSVKPAPEATPAAPTR